MTPVRKTAIDDHVEDFDTLLGLAKEAASQPSARAQEDAFFYLGQAERRSHVDMAIKQEIEEIFLKTMPERIKHIEQAIKKYRKENTPKANTQADWYEMQLTKLKALRKR